MALFMFGCASLQGVPRLPAELKSSSTVCGIRKIGFNALESRQGNIHTKLPKQLCMLRYQSKTIEGEGLANNIGNIYTAKSLQKSRKQFAIRQKRYPRQGPGSCLCYTSILITFIGKVITKNVLKSYLQTIDIVLILSILHSKTVGCMCVL